MGQRVWLAVALVSLLVVVHHFAWPLLPERTVRINPAAVQPLGAPPSVAYAYAFTGTAPDRPQNPHSRVRLFEDDNPLLVKTAIGRAMMPLRGGAWSHVPGYILFSASDNSDPRDGRHLYTLRYPPLSSETAGLVAGVVFLLAVAMLSRRGPRSRAPAEPVNPQGGRWRWHLVAISVLLMAGLYANTGTLAPYANTAVPQVDPATGYLYSVDHAEFQALFNFVDGADRGQWEQSLLLRRILYPLLAWPFMHLAGFYAGGVLTNLVLAWAGLMLTLMLLRRRIGERGAVLAGWLLALYPGAAYWAGLPYLYALIFPLSLLLTEALVALSGASSLRRVVPLSLALGLGYLAYDFTVFFLPASMLVLAWQRRWGWIGVSLVCQIVPLVAWLMVLKYGLNLPLVNPNSGIYASVVSAYLDPAARELWGGTLAIAPAAAWHVWFGSNFLFLPALALAAFAVNPVTSRIRLAPAELALLATAAGVFLFINLAPELDLRWKMRGSWISRLYQPLFPVLIIFLARWWQHLPPLTTPWRWLVRLTLVATLAANAAVVFGPLLGNPLRVAEEAFFRFYTHTDLILIRPLETNLQEHGRRPLGFPRPAPAPLP